MAEGQASTRKNRVLAIAIGVAVLAAVVYLGSLKTPRHVSGLCPEIRQAELCEVLYMDEDMKSTITSLDGEGLKGLIEKLDSLSLYPLPGRRGSGGSTILMGNTDWTFYFRINGENAKVSVTVTDRGEVSVGDRVFEVRTEELEPLLEGLS